MNYNTETTERWSEQQRCNNSNCQGWDVWDSEWTTSSWSWTVRDGTVGGRRRYSAVHGVLLGNRRLWHLCECYFGAYHQPKHCCRQFTSRHGSSMFFFQQTNAPCHNPGCWRQSISTLEKQWRHTMQPIRPKEPTQNTFRWLVELILWQVRVVWHKLQVCVMLFMHIKRVPVIHLGHF